MAQPSGFPVSRYSNGVKWLAPGGALGYLWKFRSFLAMILYIPVCKDTDLITGYLQLTTNHQEHGHE